MRRKVVAIILVCFVVMVVAILRLVVFAPRDEKLVEDYKYVLKFTCQKMDREKMQATYLEYLCKSANIEMLEPIPPIKCPTSTKECDCPDFNSSIPMPYIIYDESDAWWNQTSEPEPEPTTTTPKCEERCANPLCTFTKLICN